MCIRDSHREGSLGGRGDRDRRDRRHRHPQLRHLRGREDRCLLYTSDAADERSSVDLGGRRIIKKKKPSKINDRRRQYIIKYK